MLKKAKSVDIRYKLIYNPNASKKWGVFSHATPVILEDIKALLAQYQISADFFPTKGPGDATALARASIKEKYNIVIAAGGDGTVSEVAAGLIGSEMVMGVLPLGTFMNTASALSIPMNLEMAVSIIKLNRTRKIDVGQIQMISGEKLKEPHFFLENAGVGLEAQLQEEFLELERGDWSALGRLLRLLFDFYAFKVRVVLDDREIHVRSGLVEISNGPMTGANLSMAPIAKLNDHRLTVSVFRMTIWELILYFVQMKRWGKVRSRKIYRYQSKTVQITTRRPRTVHADARVFGHTPVEFSIMPNALNVITGFPRFGESGLAKRTPLDP